MTPATRKALQQLQTKFSPIPDTQKSRLLEGIRGLGRVWDSNEMAASEGSAWAELVEFSTLSAIKEHPWRREGRLDKLKTLLQEGVNPNMTWMPPGLAEWHEKPLPGEKTPAVCDYTHANTLDLAIQCGNKIALEFLLIRASTSLAVLSAKDLLERNPLNIAYSQVVRGGESKIWKKLSDNQTFGLARLLVFLRNKSQGQTLDGHGPNPSLSLCPLDILGPKADAALALGSMDKPTGLLISELMGRGKPKAGKKSPRRKPSVPEILSWDRSSEKPGRETTLAMS
jgi:hypothetical protein